jgi:hypothetical protein
MREGRAWLPGPRNGKRRAGRFQGDSDPRRSHAGLESSLCDDLGWIAALVHVISDAPHHGRTSISRLLLEDLRGSDSRDFDHRRAEDIALSRLS